MDTSKYIHPDYSGLNEKEMEELKERYPVQQIICHDEETEQVEELKAETDELGVGEDTRERG